ncbi:MAG: type II toxin-antitoxin system YafQ family toxin [Acidobacteriota bacterium]
MRTLFWAKTFVRAHKRAIKKHPSLRGDVEAALRLLQETPFDPALGTHKLHGPLAGSWGCSVRYDLRVVFDFVQSASKGEDDILLITIGTHDEVY